MMPESPSAHRCDVPSAGFVVERGKCCGKAQHPREAFVQGRWLAFSILSSYALDAVGICMWKRVR